MTTVQRGFLEIPRELPGFLCLVITALLSAWVDTKKMIFAQILMIFGMLVLGFFTPQFYVMSIFLFIYSSGSHLAMPLQDSIGMGLAEPDRVGARMGQYSAVRTAAGMVTGLIIFFGFRYGWFSFTSKIRLPFLIAVGFFICSFILYNMLHKQTKGKLQEKPKEREKFKLVFKEKYAIYYALSLARGFHNQILFVYAPWILIELMNKKADTISLLNVGGSLIGVLFLPIIGKLIDKIGVKKLLIFESSAFIVIYGAYAYISRALNTGAVLSTATAVLIFVCAFYILEKMFSLMSMVRSVYVRGLVSDSKELTQLLATGLSLDHVVSVTFAFLGGVIWSEWGPEYVFYLAGISCIFTFIVSFFIKTPPKPDEETILVAAENEDSENYWYKVSPRTVVRGFIYRKRRSVFSFFFV